MIIGHLVIKETCTFAQGQEFAGAVTTVEVEPGRYPIQICQDRYGSGYVAIKMDGTQIYDAWFGSNVRIDKTRKPSSITLQPYLHTVAGEVLGDSIVSKHGNVELEDGCEAYRHHFTSGGRDYSTTKIRHNGADIEAR